MPDCQLCALPLEWSKIFTETVIDLHGQISDANQSLKSLDNNFSSFVLKK